MKTFNTEDRCIPGLHYMADLSSKLAQIREMTNRGEYLAVSRPAGYGKTTLLHALADVLGDLERNAGNLSLPFGLMELFDHISDLCSLSDCGIVLIIDDVDSAVNYPVFYGFLAQLRGRYLARTEYPALWSVILAGICDVRYLHRNPIPWNIAPDFRVDMSLHTEEIAGMLEDYCREHSFRMDTAQAAGLICDYTCGHPYLVSRLCRIIDERLDGGISSAVWSQRGIDAAAEILLQEKNRLYDFLRAELAGAPGLKELISRILLDGYDVPFIAIDHDIEQAAELGFIRNENGKAVIANRIIETVLYREISTRMKQKINI